MNTKEIPVQFLRAIDPRDRQAYFDLHREYKQRYKPPSGHLTDKEAWEYLESDLEEFGLPGRYSSYGSFRSERCRATAFLVRSDG